MTRDDVEIHARDVMYHGFFRIERYRLRHKLHAGGWSGEVMRELFARGHAAALLPYDPKLDAVVLIEQFRVGAYCAGRGPWITEIIAGMIDEGETAEEAARREAIEEAGLTVADIVPITTYLTSPGASSETVAIFCGRVDASNAGGIYGIGHEQEDIRVIVLKAAEAFALRRRNKEIEDSITVNSLLWLELEREALRARWR
jgi:ADP-ribose pyrophosphatase